jgi:hypothetical protein
MSVLNNHSHYNRAKIREGASIHTKKEINSYILEKKIRKDLFTWLKDRENLLQSLTVLDHRKELHEITDEVFLDRVLSRLLRLPTDNLKRVERIIDSEGRVKAISEILYCKLAH